MVRLPANCDLLLFHLALVFAGNSIADEGGGLRLPIYRALSSGSRVLFGRRPRRSTRCSGSGVRSVALIIGI